MISKFGSPEETIIFAGAHAVEYAPQYTPFAAQWRTAIKVLRSQGIADRLSSLI